MNVVICHEATARDPGSSSLYLAGASKKTRGRYSGPKSARPFASWRRGLSRARHSLPFFARTPPAHWLLPPRCDRRRPSRTALAARAAGADIRRCPWCL